MNWYVQAKRREKSPKSSFGSPKLTRKSNAKFTQNASANFSTSYFLLIRPNNVRVSSKSRRRACSKIERGNAHARSVPLFFKETVLFKGCNNLFSGKLCREEHADVVSFSCENALAEVHLARDASASLDNGIRKTLSRRSQNKTRHDVCVVTPQGETEFLNRSFRILEQAKSRARDRE